MSDTMLLGVLRMPYELAMADELSRQQFYCRVQEAVERMRSAEAALAQVPPPECQTDAEKRAFAFGWWRATEAQRTTEALYAAPKRTEVV